MTRLYVDSLFASQGARKIWAAGTASAEVVDSGVAFGTIALALAEADGDAGTVIRIGPGSYAVPSVIDAAVVQLEGCGSGTTTVTGNCRLEASCAMRCENLTLAGSWSVYGSMGLVRVEIGASGGAVASGAYGAIAAAEWSGAKPYKTDSGGVSLYPAAKFPVGGPGGRRPSEYRLLARLEAPAKGRGEAGGEDLRWVWLKNIKVRRQDQTGRESQQGNMAVADSTGMFYCRGGVPVHPDMRLTIYGQTFQITGVSQSTSPENELTLFVNERLKAV